MLKERILQKMGRKSSGVPLLKWRGKYGYVYYGGRQISMGVGEQAEENYKKFLLNVFNGTGNSQKFFTVDDVIFSYVNSNSFKKLDRWKQKSFKRIFSFLHDEFGDYRANDFSPIKFKNLRMKYLDEIGNLKKHDEPLSAAYFNTVFDCIIIAFKNGVEEEIVDESVYRTLKIVSKINPYDTPKLRFSKSREAVSADNFDKTIQFVSNRVIADVLKIIRITAARPSEILNLELDEIDASSEIWKCSKKKHKTIRKGKKRFIPMGAQCQEILKKYIGNEGLIFAKENGRAYTSDDLNHYIKQAIKIAKKHGVEIERWTSYQLRHLRVSEIAFEFGVEAAQRIAGHASVDMTENYIHSQYATAESVAKKIG